MNSTIQKQLSHRSIRAFKDTPISQEIIDTLVEVARHTATSSFSQSATLISVTDPNLKDEIARVCKQPYVAQASHLFIVVLDMYRNHAIATEAHTDTEVLGSTDRFLGAAMDCGLMAQNIVTAAESLDLGTVYLGSIQNDAQTMIDLLNLPEYTFPLLGIAIGEPDQEPQLKPKLPEAFMHFENSYTKFENYHDALKDYDAVVTTYYDLRNSNTRVDSFTNQMTARMNVKGPNRMKNLEVLNKQKLLKY